MRGCDGMLTHSLVYVALVLLEGPKTPENSSRSKVGPKVGFRRFLK